MTDINNLTGLEKPLTKLVETISEGIGVIGNEIFKFDANKIKRIGEAEAEAERKKIIKKAEGQEEALAVLNRAGKRFALEQYNKQINLENIIFRSKEYLEGQVVSDESVDKDWSSRFINVAQEVSKEDVQDLLAKILAGEVRKPNTYSIRTLEVLKNLSKNELEMFNKFVSLSSSQGFFHIGNIATKSLRKYDLEFSEFIHLSDVGLFNSSTSLSVTLNLVTKESNLFHFQKNITLQIISESKEELTLGVFKFTDVGGQLYQLLVDKAKNKVKDKYLDDLKEHIQNKGFKMEIIKE